MKNPFGGYDFKRENVSASNKQHAKKLSIVNLVLKGLHILLIIIISLGNVKNKKHKSIIGPSGALGRKAGLKQVDNRISRTLMYATAALIMLSVIQSSDYLIVALISIAMCRKPPIKHPNHFNSQHEHITYVSRFDLFG